ncbi:hypothetical protein WG899_11815 [Paucibacter sp. AS339]|uniref:hypothetical protein n=1 Tax=Paucibacter hankyongi TaxID=3133434 RepID=UPI0030A5367A
MTSNFVTPMRRASWLLSLLLAACGGGGGGGSGSPEPAPLEVPPLSAVCQAGSVARLAQEAAPQQGRNSELALLSCSSAALSQIRWTQTSGPTLKPLSAGSAAISLEPAVAGSYGFELGYTDAKDRSYKAAVTFKAEPAADVARLTLRAEPSVVSGGKTSLRAWPSGLSEAELTGASYSWSQVDGPTATLGETSANRLLLTAPVVTSDQLLQLRASISLADGRILTGQFALLVQAPAARPADPLFASSDAIARVYPYRAASPYAGPLSDCVYSAALSKSSPNNLCTLGQLPLLGQATGGAVPTVEQVMDRVLVSNDWMGEVFERFLREQDSFGDYRRMLASVTAVVIGGRVRPAFYWNATGAIYLDAAYFWLTPEQRDSLSEAPDPRSNNGALLNFSTPWRYVKDNQHASVSYPVAGRQSRSLEDLRYELGRLLYHELTHAADFMPPRSHAGLPSNKRVYEAGPALSSSENLKNRLPFYSSQMQGLARVLSFGETPSAQQIAYQAADITAFFSADRVNDDYSYSVPSGESYSREDAAMLVEEGMMQLRYGVLRDFAVAGKLLPDSNSADLILNWGQRGRIGEPSIRPRLQLVLTELMPWLSPNIVDGLAAPLPLRAGLSWGANLDQAALAAGQAKPLSEQQRFNEQEQTTRMLRSR